jgi:hypothetical protein
MQEKISLSADNCDGGFNLGLKNFETVHPKIETFTGVFQFEILSEVA